jgi:Domain of unknown function (DUF1840)
VLYRFKSRAIADVVMLEPQGRRLLAVLGKDPDRPGVLLVADMPTAVAALQADGDADTTAWAQRVADAEARGESPPPLPQVMWSARLVPFLEALGRCQRENADLVWGV